MFHSPRTLIVSVLATLLFAGSGPLRADDPPEARFAAMSPDEVRAYERETLRRVADLALIPPVPNTEPLPQYDYDKLDYGMTIGIDGHADKPARKPHDPRVGHRGLHEFTAPAAPRRPKHHKHRNARLRGTP